jgi:uncharacterized protein (DUF302 family)
MMNATIETIFQDFTVDGVQIPVKFLRYNGNKTTYVTYMQQDANGSYAGDDEILGFVGFYDFDVYSKSDYSKVIEQIKVKMKENGFVWQPARDSQDMFEDDTGYYHKTLCFATHEQILES